ncbi:MAG: primosomal protein N' [Acidobacteria bacterium]|nr:primosomal protein N' [Acidobacteriota bacterium]
MHQAFTYSIPEKFSDSIAPGCRVVVPFGKRALIGVAVELTDRAPAGTKIKEVANVLDAIPAIPSTLLKLGDWISEYYLAPRGEVFRAMLPPAVEVRAQREYSLTDSGRKYLASLESAKEREETESAELSVLQLLAGEEEPVPAASLRKIQNSLPAALRLQRRGFIEMREVARDRKQRTLRIVAWNDALIGKATSKAEERIREILTALRGPLPVPQLIVQAPVSPSVIERLIRQQKLLTWEEPISDELELREADFAPPPNSLNEDQKRALTEITGWMNARQFMAGLLYGVTGSGKTEVYLRAVQAALDRGRTAIVLVPEIALTLWTSRLLRARLGERVAILHSTLPDSERSREWWRARRGEAHVVVGTRSAVFAPLDNVGLIVVDEEQESGYKQEETPRYHCRDTAIVRARMEGAVALLGSATPSLESFHNSQSGKYALLKLESRVENRAMASVGIVDLREEFQRTHKAGPISQRLHAAIAARLEAGTQSLILINRRGYSLLAMCRSCGAAVQCENCSISLTYHKKRDRLICHYCGFSRVVPKECPKCSSPYVYFFGEGAERVEEILRQEFPRAKVARLDRDAVRSKRAYQQVLNAFADGELDILVGTQMVAKGHDFQRVTLVGVIGADLTLALPDFRAAERAFQLFTQVAGRAGRGDLPGEVLVQTHYPEHYAVQFAAAQDYESFYEKELHFRRVMNYPPFTALANIIVRDRKIENAIRWSRAIAAFLESHQSRGLRVLGPAAAPLARLKREYRFQFLLKAPSRKQLNTALTACLKECFRREIPHTAVIVDVDPVSLM